MVLLFLWFEFSNKIKNCGYLKLVCFCMEMKLKNSQREKSCACKKNLFYYIKEILAYKNLTETRNFVAPAGDISDDNISRSSDQSDFINHSSKENIYVDITVNNGETYVLFYLKSVAFTKFVMNAKSDHIYTLLYLFFNDFSEDDEFNVHLLNDAKIFESICQEFLSEIEEKNCGRY
ncbi:hypothetical protein RFI_24438 [Reticulomyxa filosa]|uniref:Uncharacterized protein n=1 Tax=Reticulomyxa filosa TaxID=46433 RepID=X6MIR2_RETFI|nr:hypothetical protein RFI_24438 [Reticulomyxa filosa]|eukprot:ETO12940.1 hypothetical protein RFI_24438 [Reticulomyxa filosa]